MKKFLGYVWMWLGSFVIAIGFTYGAGTLIKNITQTATKGDIITSDWVNEVNKKINGTEYIFSKGSYYGLCKNDSLYYDIVGVGDGKTLETFPYCKTADYPAQCVQSTKQVRTRTNSISIKIGTCTCPSGFIKVNIGPDNACYKN